MAEKSCTFRTSQFVTAGLKVELTPSNILHMDVALDVFRWPSGWLNPVHDLNME